MMSNYITTTTILSYPLRLGGSVAPSRPPRPGPSQGLPQPVPVGARACLTRLPYSARLVGPDASTRARVVGGVGSGFKIQDPRSKIREAASRTYSTMCALRCLRGVHSMPTTSTSTSTGTNKGEGARSLARVPASTFHFHVPASTIHGTQRGERDPKIIHTLAIQLPARLHEQQLLTLRHLFTTSTLTRREDPTLWVGVGLALSPHGCSAQI